MNRIKMCIAGFVVYLMWLLLGISVNYGLCNGNEPFGKLFRELSIVYGVCVLFVLLYNVFVWCLPKDVTVTELRVKKAKAEYDIAIAELERIRKGYEKKLK